MTTEEAFLEDICARPDDDAPRLVYADWLDDRGAPGDAERARFIRVQCWLAKGGVDGASRISFQQEAKKLLEAHWREWARPVLRLFGLSPEYFPNPVGLPDGGLAWFQRGFLAEMRLKAPLFLKHGEALLRLAPVHTLRLTGAAAVAAGLAECPQLERLREIEFLDYYIDPITAEAMARLAASPYLGNLRVLRLYQNNLANDGVRALAGAWWLGGVEQLELADNGITAFGVQALATTALPFRPVVLGLGANPIGDAGAGHLASSPILGRLRSLRLVSCAIGPGGMGAFAASPHLGELRRLVLDGNPIEEEGGRRLLAAGWLKQLHRLSVERCGLSPDLHRSLTTVGAK